jgi:hypothetical protein
VDSTHRGRAAGGGTANPAVAGVIQNAEAGNPGAYTSNPAMPNVAIDQMAAFIMSLFGVGQGGATAGSGGQVARHLDRGHQW